MLDVWVRVGQDPDLFWRSTPKVVGVILGAANKRQIDEHNNRAWLAFNIAGFSRMKRLTVKDLKSIQIKVREPRRPQTIEQQRAVLRAIAAMYGALPPGK